MKNTSPFVQNNTSSRESAFAMRSYLSPLYLINPIYFDARLFSSFTVAYKEKVSVSNGSSGNTLKPVVNTSCR